MSDYHIAIPHDDYYIAIPHDDYADHHGVLGMKWGVRRYQNADGSYTAAGRARYLSDVKSRGGNVKKAAAKWDAEVAKQKKPKKKSDHRLKLEAKYKASGMTKKEAEEAADKQIQKEKKIAIGAGIAAAAAGTAYGLHKYHDYSTDRIIGSDENPLYRMQVFNGKDQKDGAIYGVYNKKDTLGYNGYWAKNMKNRLKQGVTIDNAGNIRKPSNDDINAYSMKLVFNKGKGIKVASDKHAKKIFNDLSKNDPEFRKQMKSFISQNAHGMAKGHNDYEKFVIGMYGDRRNTDVAKKYFNEVRKHGYGAIKDVNDNKYSGFARKGKSAVLAFANDKYDWTARVLDDSEIDKNAKKFVAREMTHNALKSGAAVGAISSAPMVLEAYAISKSKPARAMSLHKAGVSDEDIAKQLDMPVSKVKKISRPNNKYRRPNNNYRRYA